MTGSTGSGRMEAMPRPLAAGGFSQTVAEDDYARQKSAAAYIYRQLREADEANLLSEEDMHVYGERPMTDPLTLVRCNTCKKPIKDSQFAAHAELCRSLKLTEQTRLELNGNTRNRKPPRNDKRKLSASSAAGKRRKYESLDNIDTVVSQSHLNSQIRGTSFSNDVKDAAASMLDDTGVSCGNRVLQASVMYPPTKHHKLKTSTHISVIDEHGMESGVSKAASLTNGTTHAAPTSMLDDTGVNSGNRVLQASVMYPPTKRHKLMASTHIAVIEEHGTEFRVSKAASLTNGTTRKDMTEEIVSEHGDPFHKNGQQVHMQQHQDMKNNDFPAPLATKIYYSQRTNRLRAAIRHMYFENLSEEVRADVECPKTSNEEMVALQGLSQVDPSIEQMDNVVNKESHLGMMYTKNSDDILAKTSEVCLLKAGGVPSDGLSNQFFLDNVSRSAATHVGLTRGSFLPKAYSFPSNTGNRLEALQQPNGSVPVI